MKFTIQILVFLTLSIFVSSCAPKAPFTKEIIFQATPFNQQIPLSIDIVKTILGKRLEGFGESRPFCYSVNVIGNDKISVKISDISENELDELKKMLTKRGRLAFHLGHKDSSSLVTEMEKNDDLKIPGGYILMTTKNPDYQITKFIVKIRASMVNNIEVAYPRQDHLGYQSIVINFTAQGRKKLAEVTQSCVGNPLATVVDDKLYSAPIVMEKITTGNAQISGGLTKNEAKKLAVILNSGELPCKLSVSEVRDIKQQNK